MASLVSGLDNIVMENNKNIGENSHAQHAWTHADFEHDLVQLYFQLVRIPKHDTEKIKNITKKYSLLVNNAVQNSNEMQINYCMSILFQTRDICGGKGEYALFYNLLAVWESTWEITQYKLSLPLKLCFTTENTDFDKPYGSWKDVKYIIDHWRQYYQTSRTGLVATWEQYPILSYIIKLSVKQFITDLDSKSPSLVTRWLPREKSSFGWQAQIFAELFSTYPKVESNVTWSNSQKKGMLRKYRKELGKINRRLQTIQINQAGKTWKNIDFGGHGTSLTLQRQKKAFLCEGTNKNAVEDPDRIACRSNYLQYLDDCRKGKKQMKSKRLSLGEMVKDAAKHFDTRGDNTLVDAINLAWRDHDKPSHLFKDCIAMLDTSASMTWENCPYYDAVGIALKIAECSTLGKRTLTFSSQPAWVNLEGRETLTDMLYDVVRSQVGMSTNIYKALNLIATACIEQDLSPSVVSNINLVILSDMQIDAADSDWNTLDQNIQQLFEEAGKKTSHATPYSSPTIIYWNMRNTNGFPCSTTRKNVIMVSGYSPDVLKSVFSKGPDALKDMKPWDALAITLGANRYSWFWS